jgi:hypothetical protein
LSIAISALYMPFPFQFLKKPERKFKLTLEEGEKREAFHFSISLLPSVLNSFTYANFCFINSCLKTSSPFGKYIISNELAGTNPSDLTVRAGCSHDL